jgi:glycosyltransferase involved in cell wall biosynthesis
VRVLHVLGTLNPGGVERWLLDVLRRIDRDRCKMDFLVHVDRPGAYDEEARALGAELIPCPFVSHPLRYQRRFSQILHDHGPYDVVHSHVHAFSGFVLRLAARQGIAKRIAHSHNDTKEIDDRGSLVRRAYLAVMRRSIARYATLGLAASHRAGEALFRPRWGSDERFRVLLYGLDLAPFLSATRDPSFRSRLGIPDGAFVIGHVGRLVPQKNHSLLLQAVACAAQREPRVHLLLVGEGASRTQIENEARTLGIANRLTMTGTRHDVTDILVNAMDVFAFPSLYEGLGLALVEAQAAGLPCVFSDIVPQEADVIRPMLRRLSLSDPPTAWAEALLERRDSRLPVSAACTAVGESAFDIRRSIHSLLEAYVAIARHVESRP